MAERAMILPPLRRTAADAAKFAKIVHEGQTDKAGRPYVEHLARVAAGVLRLSEGCPFWGEEERDEAAQIAWLHDAVEDDAATPLQMLVAGYARPVARAIDCFLTNRGSPYPDFIHRICNKASLATILVKLADVTDNSDPDRLALLPEADRERLTRKYAGAKEILQAAARAKGWRA